ncbi:hypothetical protein P170DRAFT_184290 [Aspergillus steynii IBT 23096]|uniref:Uncharacterized protein n=1 Tax=Aspergillus steynii IBT 23096 TaxID=1392250 RepID=A0A2I2G990_9EURO|nr:uncharacterized protein P170DRAFT_184290 [Aspergillus steynii IBT 23096]PLB49441.1 hypothetical protein P170DRAFT_184290 [Aspergillus steynii IBT 23096]
MTGKGISRVRSGQRPGRRLTRGEIATVAVGTSETFVFGFYQAPRDGANGSNLEQINPMVRIWRTTEQSIIKVLRRGGHTLRRTMSYYELLRSSHFRGPLMTSDSTCATRSSAWAPDLIDDQFSLILAPSEFCRCSYSMELSSHCCIPYPIVSVRTRK